MTTVAAPVPGKRSLANCHICMGGEETETICTVSEHLPFALECNISYFRSIMEALAQRLPDFADHTFVFTRSVTELPRKFDYLPSLVVFVMGDEWARVPLYAHRVHAVFKAPGQDMKLALHKGWLRFNLMAYVQQLRQRCKRYPHHHIDRCNNLFAIPYGYYRLPTRDKVTPINRRAIDVSFTGSVDHKKVLGGLVKTNKVLSRERMVRTVDSWKRHKTYTTDVKLSGYFPKANDKPEFESYPRILMDTKICLSPRGTHLETYRLCEGMYYGCIVIAEEQPDHWFAENSPAIIVDDWRELPQWLDRLLEDPQEMQRRQQASIDYWDSTLAPDRIAAYLSNTLQSMRSPDAANDTLAPLKIDHAA